MEQKLVRVPFDIEMAKKITSGDMPGKVVTRDERGVRIICWDRKNKDCPIVALILNECDVENIMSFTKDGTFWRSGAEDKRDLFLEIPEYLTYKDGDIIYGEVDNGGGDYCKWLSIVKEIDCIQGKPYVVSYVDYIWDSSYNCGALEYMGHSDNFDLIRLATEEEKARFAKRLQENKDPVSDEYLEKYFGITPSPKLSNSAKIGKNEFKPFDRVLVRQSKADKWEAMLFSNYTSEPHRYRCGGMNYMFCIPYEGNENLIDTNKSPESHE